MPALLLVAVLSFSPSQVPSAHLIETQALAHAELSTGRLLSAPFVGLFGELVGAQLALFTVQPVLTPAADLLPHNALVGLSIGFAALSSVVISAAALVLIQPFLEQHQLQIRRGPLWLAGTVAMLICTVAGAVVGALSGNTLLGLVGGIGAGIVATPITETVVAAHIAAPRPQLAFTF